MGPDARGPKSRRRRLLVGVAGVLIALPVFASFGLASPVDASPAPASGSPGREREEPPEDPSGATVTTHLSGVDPEVTLERGGDGSIQFVLEGHEDDAIVLTPEEFARRVYDEQSGRPWWKQIFNITSPAGLLWVGLGFLGQALFSGRMLVQWIVSERRKRSVVPVAFWWLSLTGASMLLVYFIWRKDIVGVLGQTTGWAIYLRNLWFLYTKERSETA